MNPKKWGSILLKDLDSCSVQICSFSISSHDSVTILIVMANEKIWQLNVAAESCNFAATYFLVN